MDYLVKYDYLGLVRFTQMDMAEWSACWQDEATQRGFNFIPPQGDAWLREQRVERFPFWVTAVSLATGKVVGSLRLSPDVQPDLAIWIYPKYRGQGWGTRAYKLACEHLFANGYETIYAGCFEYNVHSRRILEKCGFRRWPKGDVTEESVFDGTAIIMQGFRCVSAK